MRAGWNGPARRAAVLGLGLLVWGAAAAPAPAAPVDLTPEARQRLERLITTRGFTRGIPRNAMPSPDGKHVYFLRSGPQDQFQQLLVFDVATGRTRELVTTNALGGTGTLSKEEQARRERQRQTERGITAFQLSDDGTLVLIPYSGDLYVVDAVRGTPRRLTSTPAAEIDPHLSPNGRWISFVRGDDLLALEIATGHETVVAHSDTPGLAYGVAEFVAQEEMDRFTGHWWSPDSNWLAFTSVDTRDVPTFRVPDFTDPSGEGNVAPYPKAGDPNAVVRLHAFRLGSGAFRMLDLGDDWEYLARVQWAPGSDALVVETQPRDQRRVDVRRCSLEGGRTTTLWQETASDWVNLHDNLRVLSGGRGMLWSSERTGHMHLEVVDGTARRALTSGDWDVTGVLDVDEERGLVTFAGNREGTTEQHVYSVPLGGGTPTRLTEETGWHEGVFHRLGHDVWVETLSREDTPPRLRVRGPGARVLGQLPSVAVVPTADDLAPTPVFEQLKGAGAEALEVRLVLPRQAPGSAKLPLVVYVYGGPGAQQVRRAWPGERGLFDGWLASQGFAVARIDGRGVRARGHASEGIFAGQLGQAELDDQVAGVRALCARHPEIDAARVGIWGWSYGGYMTLMALARAGGTFRTGVAVAPVVDWRGYDTHYTERFLKRPQDNAAGYEKSSILTHAGHIEGRLTLVHGTSDDNVHFRESMQLVQQLIDQGLMFDLMVYPGTHMIESLPERTHLYELVWRAFATGL